MWKQLASMAQLRLALLVAALVLTGAQLSNGDRNFLLLNNCAFTMWPATLSNAGMPSLWLGGMRLDASESYEYVAPAGWAGRVWGRSGCQFNTSTGAGSCQTGDCGNGLHCNGRGGNPPATLAEFALDGYGSQDYYDVSLVDGYNMPLTIEVSGAASGICGSPGCVSDLNENCHSELQVLVNSTVVACMSACEKFGTDGYCCSGTCNTPATCGPTIYSKTFKIACPTAYSYAYDDKSSTFTCGGTPDYTITFCPGATLSR